MTSSAVVGSSANSSVGPHAIAMAIMMRWRMPPDISCGYCCNRRPGAGMRTSCISRSAVAHAAFFGMSRWRRSGSAICAPIFISGFSDVIGSWKIIAISLPHTSRIAARESPPISLPSNRTLPERMVPRGGSKPMIERDRMVLPEPLSPTIPSALPRSSFKETPSTARTTPRGVSKYVRTSSSSSSGPSTSLVDAWILMLIRQPHGCRTCAPIDRR